MANSFLHTIQKVGAKILDESLATRRKLTGKSAHVFNALGIFFALFFIYEAGPHFLGAISMQLKRGLFMMVLTTLIFMKYPATKKSSLNKVDLVDVILILCSVFAFGYWIYFFDDMTLRFGTFKPSEVWIATLAILLTLEAGRRVLGTIFPMIAVIFLFYAYFGDFFSRYFLASKGFTWEPIAMTAYSINGIFGMVLDIIASFVILFVIFGALMKVFGADVFFIQLPFALTAGMRGGPAKTAVVASCMFGSISGSATANTAATGAFTIPLMIKTGYPREIAGAIEPAASTGGMFMPPVMGAATFIMADMLKMPYGNIVKAAIVPAIIYFFSVFMIAHFYAYSKGIPIIPREQRLDPWELFKQGWYFLIPILLLLYLLFNFISPSRSIYWTIIATFFISAFVRLTTKKQPVLVTLKEYGRELLVGLRDGAEESLTIGAVAGSTGIVIGMVLLTGLAFSFTASVMVLTKGVLAVGIFMAFLASYILGMGMTVTSVYILLAILVVPALVKLGVSPLAAHFLVFWYSQTSNISPPVCVAAFVGAGIAKAEPFKVGFNSLRFAAFLFIMPLLFVYSEIMMPNGMNFNAAFAMVSGFLATVPYAAAVCAYLYKPLGKRQRLFLFASSFLLVLPSLWSTVLGAIIAGSIYFYQRFYQSNQPVNPAA